MSDTPIMANRVPSMISTLCNYAMTEHIYEMPRNPCAGVPLPRQGLSEDCAHAVAFLASDASAYLTGVNLDINGGLAFS